MARSMCCNNFGVLCREQLAQGIVKNRICFSWKEYEPLEKRIKSDRFDCLYSFVTRRDKGSSIQRGPVCKKEINAGYRTKLQFYREVCSHATNIHCSATWMVCFAYWNRTEKIHDCYFTEICGDYSKISTLRCGVVHDNDAQMKMHKVIEDENEGSKI